MDRLSADDDTTRAELSVATARWLVGDEGLAAVVEATGRLDRGDEPLRVATWLEGSGLDAPRRSAVLGAAQARCRARARWSDADQLVFTRTALEQASDPVVSGWRARRFASVGPVEDRAAGAGGDTLALAAVATGPVVAVDLDAARLTLLEHNARVRGLEVTTVVGDALVHPAPPTGAVHADPGRRVGERRVRTLADHRPSVPALLTHLAGPVAGAGVAVVTSPAVDLDDPGLPADAELEFVQVGRDLVEAVLWTGALRERGVDASATLLDVDGTVRVRTTRGPRPAVLPVGPPGEVLIEVAPAAVRARLHDQLLVDHDARRLALRRAVLTAPAAPPTSPWWTVRPIVGVVPARPAAVRRWLRDHEPRPVELVRHGLEGDLAAFRRGIGRPPTGPHGWRVELVRTDDGAVAVITDGSPASRG